MDLMPTIQITTKRRRQHEAFAAIAAVIADMPGSGRNAHGIAAAEGANNHHQWFTISPGATDAGYLS
jgi:hypothetical protein